MKSLILAAVLVLTSASFAATKTQMNQNFFLNSDFDFGEKIYFNCRSVEDQFTTLLKTLDASDIKVSCTGGITEGVPPIGWDNASVTASFTALQDNTDSQGVYKPVKLNQFDSCFLMTQLFKQVEHSFSMKDLKVTRTCMEADEAFHLQAEVLN